MTLILIPQRGSDGVREGVLVSPASEVLVIDGEVMTAIRTVMNRGVGKKTIAREHCRGAYMAIHDGTSVRTASGRLRTSR